MSGNNESLAKIARPRSRNVYRRASLFDRLDVARRSSAIWISAPAGAGKTTLVNSYLDEQDCSCIWYHVDETDADIATIFWYMRLAAKTLAPQSYKQLPAYTSAYRGGLTAFSLRYFEKLYAMLQPNFVIVFDDYHLAQGSDSLNKVVSQAISVLPGFANIIVASREPLPTILCRLLGNETLQLLDWDHLRLSPEEARGIAAMRHPSIGAAELDRISARSAGWAAGLIFGLQSVDLGVLNDAVGSSRSHDALFGYFANEVFEQQDGDTQALIMRLALLPQMTQAMACRMSGKERAGALLNWLHRHNYFVNLLALQLPTYKFHPLFRDFLLDRLRQSCDSAELEELYQQAATVMEGGGYAESACRLYQFIGDWANVARLIAAGAPEKFRQGRLQSLADEIGLLPEEVLGQKPWLLYWLGMCDMFLEPGRGHAHFSLAFERFQANDEPVGMMASWAGAVNSLLADWADIKKIDEWVVIAEQSLPADIQQIDRAMGAHVTASMCFALFLCRPNSEQLARIVEKTDAALVASDDLTFSLMGCNLMLIFYGWQGEITKGRLLLDAIRAKMTTQSGSDSHRVMWAAAEGWLELIAGKPQDCLNICTQALSLADISGVHIFDNKFFGMAAQANLLLGRTGEAGDYLRRYIEIAPAHANLVQFHIHFLSGWERWRSGDHSSAREHLRLATGFLEIAGSPPIITAKTHLARARLHIEAGEDAESRRCLAAARRIADTSESTWLRFNCVLLEAEMHCAAGRENDCLNALRNALQLASRNNLVATDWWHPEVMSQLMERALLEGIEPDYARHIISKMQLKPGRMSDSSAAWPWPIAIEVLGAFQLKVNGEVVSNGVQGQKKVLELLKALTVFGSEGASVCTLADYIWPDSDGDDARNALKTTVHRLRKLLGDTAAVEQRDGSLRLNPELCWSDVDAFRVLAKTPRASQDRVRKLKKALELHKGPLLPTEEMLWAITPRKKLQRIEHKLVMELGTRYEKRCRWNKAIRIYRQGLESDSLDEQVCRHLMKCYQRSGRESDALTAYELYCDQLEQRVSRRPSAKTRTLAESMLS